MPYAVYILKCSDGTYYTGLTKDLDGRMHEHQLGAYPESYTFGRRPVKLVWSEVSESYPEAFHWEHQIKGWSRAKKEALIAGDWPAMQWLAKRPSARARILGKQSQ